MKKHPILKVVIGTFHDEIEEELKSSYPDLFRGAFMGAATDFILLTEIANSTP